MIDLNLAICTYNNARLLRLTLESLEQQRLEPCQAWEAIVVDNNCADETSMVMGEFVKRGRIPRLRIVKETQQGLSYARRRAVLETDSPWVAFVDDDCLLAPDWVSNAIAFAQAHERAGVVGGKVELQWESSPSEDVLELDIGFARQNYGLVPVRLTNRTAQVVGVGMVVRRDALLASGWLERMLLIDRAGGALASGGDTEITFRIRRAGYELWYNPAMKVQHIIPAQRMEPAYLRRLFRGFGDAGAIVRSLSPGTKPTLIWKLNLLREYSLLFLRRVLEYAVHFALFRKKKTAVRQVLLDEALGKMLGAWDLLRCRRPQRLPTNGARQDTASL